MADEKLYRNVIYGKLLWKQMNMKNAFSAIPKTPYTSAGFGVVTRICANCLKEIPDEEIATLIKASGEILCEQCYDEKTNYTSKW